MADPTHRPHQLLSITVCDPPEGWKKLGFHLNYHPSSGLHSVQLGNTAIMVVEPQSDNDVRGITGWHIDGVDHDLAGLQTIRHDPELSRVTNTSLATTSHTNGIQRIDHIVVQSGRPQQTIDAVSNVGLTPRRGRVTTSYGAPMLQTFFWLGDVILELVGPASSEAERDDAPEFFGLALVASNLSATEAALGNLIATRRKAVQQGREIAGLKTRDVDVAVPIVIMTPHVKP